MTVGGCSETSAACATAGMEMSAPDAMNVRHEVTRAVLVNVLLRGVTDTPGRGRLLLRHAVLLLSGHKEGIEIHERGLAQVRRVCIFVTVYSRE